MKIKICGLRSMDDVGYVNRYLPDYAGFILSSGFKRSITADDAKGLSSALLPSIKAVGVFVNEDISSVISFVDRGIIDVIQLHGDEDEGYIDNLRAGLKNMDKDVPLIKAFVVKSDSDVINASKSSADMILLDSGRGSGREFDRKLLLNFNRDHFLAGGISMENIGLILDERTEHLTGLDISSGVEIDGKKNPGLIRDIISAIRERDKKND